MSQMMIYVLLGIATWIYLAPGIEGWKTFSPDWIFHVWAFNMGLSIVVAGGLHLYFHTWKCQGKVQRYEHRDLASKKTGHSSSTIRSGTISSGPAPAV